MAKAKRRVVCLHNDGCEASLEIGKAYVALRDPLAEKRDLLRITDESDQDYLYPKAFFGELSYGKRSGRR
jgi:hypothetical protein